MTTEPPTPAARPARPDRDTRRRALGIDPDAVVARPTARRQSLAAELARIPDLTEEDRRSGGVRRPVPVGGKPGPEVPSAAPAAAAVAGARVAPGAGSPGRPHRPGVVATPTTSGAVVLTEVDRSSGPGDAPAAEPMSRRDEVTAPAAAEPERAGVAGSLRAAAARLAAGSPVVDPAVDPAVAPPGSNGSGPAAEHEASGADGPGDPAHGSVAESVAVAGAVAAPRVPEPSVARARGPAHRVAPPPPAPWWRRVGFAAAVIVLVAAIPLLGRAGYRLVTQSTAGQMGTSTRSPTDPGYEELVASTPTALVMQNDADGVPVALTFLSLPGSSGGGMVMTVPLETAVREPAYGVDRLSGAYTALAERPPDGRKQVGVQTANLLNVGIDEVIEVDDRRWAQLVEPVGGLTIENPDSIDIGSAVLPAGTVQLSPEQVGPYLAARSEGESDLASLSRQELVWAAWLEAVAESDRPEAVPGETEAGIGRFVRTLAEGPVTYTTLPVVPADDGTGRFLVDDGTLADLLVDAVPAPTPAFPGSRVTVRVLNGVAPEVIPDEIFRRVVRAQGSITVIGNGPSFGRTTTSIVYADPARKGHALLLQAALGGVGTVRYDAEATDSVDLTLVLGSDLLDDLPGTATTASTGTTVEGAPGDAGTTDDTEFTGDGVPPDDDTTAIIGGP